MGKTREQGDRVRWSTNSDPDSWEMESGYHILMTRALIQSYERERKSLRKKLSWFVAEADAQDEG